MRLLLVTDAWAPQVNGVVRTLQRCKASARRSATASRWSRPSSSGRVPCPTYPEIRLALVAGPRHRRADRGVAARCHPHRDRRPARRRRAPPVPAARAAVHHLAITPAFPNTCSARFPVPLGAGLCRGALVPPRRPAAVMVATRRIRARPARRAASPTSCDWSRGVDTELFRPDRAPALRPAASGPSLRRPGRGREESRGVPVDCRSPGSKLVVGDGPQLRRASGAAILKSHFAGAQVRRGPRAPLRQRRRVRVPEPHRHLRPGAARGARRGPAGRGLPGAGTARRHRRLRLRCARPRPRPSGGARARRSRARAAARTPSPSHGAAAPSSSSAICTRSQRLGSRSTRPAPQRNELSRPAHLSTRRAARQGCPPRPVPIGRGPLSRRSPITDRAAVRPLSGFRVG